MKVELPYSFKPETLHALEVSLREGQLIDNVNVDFSPLYWSYPMAMLVAGSYFRRWIQVRRDNNLNTTHSGISEKRNAHKYLMHLGFFDYAGMLDKGKKIGVAKGNTGYLPIRKITLKKLNNSIEETGESLIDAINFESRTLATVLSGDDSEIKNAFSYSIREIIRNTLEHSGSDHCFICAQKWANGQSEIAIVDEGCGIHESLSIAYDVQEDEALQCAIRPGVTRTKKLTEKENIHNNSGFGLYVLSELGNSFGWFCVGSGGKRLNHEKKKIEVSDLFFSGTFVGVHLDVHPKSFQGTLEDIIQAGEEESEKEGRVSVASELSKTI
jgi:hypothetical protein